MRKVEDRPRALVEHVGIEALGAKQGNVALESEPHLLETGELAFEHVFPSLKLGARGKAVITGLEVIGEIAGRAAGQKRKDERSEPHPRESAREPLSGRYREGFNTDRPA